MWSAHLHSVTLLLLLFFSTSYGDNRELVPLDAPTNLTLLEIKGRQVLIEWEAVDPESVRGNFRGYLVRTWNHAGSQVYAFPPEVTRANVEFFPFSKNFITVSARNEKYVGPPSEAISFDAPQIEPNLPYVLNVFSLSDKSVLLQWTKPTEPNGILLGYKIYCSEINDTLPIQKNNEISHQINDPDKFQAKLTGMQEGITYKIGISALNCAGESDIKTTEVTMEPHTSAKPFIPKLIVKINYTTPDKNEVCYKSSFNAFPIEEDEIGKQGQEYDYYDYMVHNETKKSQIKPKPTTAPEIYHEKHCLVDGMVLWIPDVRNNPGEYFYLKYRIKGEDEFQVTEPEMSEDFIVLHNFDACKNYEIILTAVYGDYSTDSNSIITPTKIF